MGCNVGVAFRGVRDTGAFHSRVKKNEIRQIYDKLSTGTLVPRALGFVFDRESLCEVEVADLERLGIRLLPRRMFENYLLVPAAIAAVLNTTDTFRGQQIEQENVDEFVRKLALDLNDPAIHGAAVLSDVFEQLSGSREIYRKVEHGEALTRQILSTDPARFDEIRAILAGILSPA